MHSLTSTAATATGDAGDRDVATSDREPAPKSALRKPSKAAKAKAGGKKKTEAVCEKDTCGCLPAKSTSGGGFRKWGACGDPIGSCSAHEGSISCDCGERHRGDRCDECAVGFFDYPNCNAKLECSECAHGAPCNFGTGKCECPPSLVGELCETCAPGLTGDNCDEKVARGGGRSWGATVAGVFFLLFGVCCMSCYIGMRRRQNKQYVHSCIGYREHVVV